MPKTFFFNCAPMGAPRLNRSDRWKRRPVAVRYFGYKDRLWSEAIRQEFELPDEFTIVFYMPFPKTYSRKKKEKLADRPHRQKPDLDNLLKGFQDALAKEDKFIHTVRAKKVWSYLPGVEIVID